MKTLQTIWQELFQPLSAFGYEKGQGTTRLSWSKPFLEAQQYLRHYGEAIGLQCRRDGWGNLLMTVPGETDLPPVYTGSHLDSVPHGENMTGPWASLSRWPSQPPGTRRDSVPTGR